MKWPCAHCPIIAKHRYGHYYGVCDGCKEMEEYEVWAEKQETKRLLNLALQKSRNVKIKERESQS